MKVKLKNIFTYVLPIFIFFVCSCNNKHRTTWKKENGLYVEAYSTGLIGNLTSHYLTDSTNFRLYVGTFDPEVEGYNYKIDGNDLYIEKLLMKPYNKREVIKKMKYRLNILKKEHKFDRFFIY